MYFEVPVVLYFEFPVLLKKTRHICPHSLYHQILVLAHQRLVLVTENTVRWRIFLVVVIDEIWKSKLLSAEYVVNFLIVNAKFFFHKQKWLKSPLSSPFFLFHLFHQFHWWWLGRFPPLCKALWVPRKALYKYNKLLLLSLRLTNNKRVSHFLCIMTTFLKGYHFIFALLCSLYIDNRPIIIWSICKSRIFVFCSYLYDCSLLEYIHVSLPCFCMFLHV